MISNRTKLGELRRERNRLQYRSKQLLPILQTASSMVELVADDEELHNAVAKLIGAIEATESQSLTVLELLENLLRAKL